MGILRWSAFTTWQKAILWIGLLLCVWRYLQVPAVFDAILRFCAAGEVPGTAITLSADVVLWTVFGISAGGAAAIFIRLFIFRPLVHQYRLNRLPPTPPPAVVAAAPRQVRAYRMSLYFRARVRPLGAALQALLRALRQAVALTFRLFLRISRWTVVLATVIAQEVWATVRPFAVQVDDWLRTVLNDYGPTAALLQAVRGTLAATQLIMRKTIAAAQPQHRQSK